MKCQNCSAEIPENAKFCLECGEPVVPEDYKESTDNAEETANPSENGASNNKLIKFVAISLTIIIVVAAIAVIIALIAGISANESKTASSASKSNRSSYTESVSKKDTSSSEVVSSSDTPSVEEENLWEIAYYSDDFGGKTSDWYVANTSLFYGTFSNSATNNSKLTVQIAVDAKNFTVFLYEYATNQVKNPFSRATSYEVKIRDDSGNEYNGYGQIPAKGDRIFLNAETQAAAIKYLKTSQSVTFVLKNDLDFYRFTVQSDNFAQLIN